MCGKRLIKKGSYHERQAPTIAIADFLLIMIGGHGSQPTLLPSEPEIDGRLSSAKVSRLERERVYRKRS
jgi:hypothetical protein